MIANELAMFSNLVVGKAMRRHFFAVYEDGREERIDGVTVNAEETLDEALRRVCKELGARSIIIRHQAETAGVK